MKATTRLHGFLQETTVYINGVLERRGECRTLLWKYSNINESCYDTNRKYTQKEYPNKNYSITTREEELRTPERVKEQALGLTLQSA